MPEMTDQMLAKAMAGGAADRRALRDDARHEFLGCLLFVAGSAIFYMMPAYLALVGGRLALDSAQLGTLAGVESLAIGISSLLGPFWVARLDRRLCLIGAAAD